MTLIALLGTIVAAACLRPEVAYAVFDCDVVGAKPIFSLCVAAPNWPLIQSWMLLFSMSFVAAAMAVERLSAVRIAGKQDRLFQCAAAEALYRDRAEELPRIISCYDKSPLAAVVGTCIGGRAQNGVSMWSREQMLVLQIETLSQRLWCLTAFERSIPVIGLFISLQTAIEVMPWTQFYQETGIISVGRTLTDALGPFVFSMILAMVLSWPRRYLQARVKSFVLEMDWLSRALIERWWESQGLTLAPRSTPERDRHAFARN